MNVKRLIATAVAAVLGMLLWTPPPAPAAPAGHFAGGARAAARGLPHGQQRTRPALLRPGVRARPDLARLPAEPRQGSRVAPPMARRLAPSLRPRHRPAQRPR